MDVADRATRLDVVTATSTPATAGTPSAKPPEPNSPSFADSFARPGRNSPTASSDGAAKQSPASATSETAPPPPAARPETDAPTANAPSAVAKDQSSTPLADSAARSNDSDQAESALPAAVDSVEESIQVLMSGLVAVATAAPPPLVAAAGSESPVLTPPTSLVAALHAAHEVPTATAPSDGPQPLTPLPAMPAALQLGLSPRSASTGPAADAPIVDVPHFAQGQPTLSMDQTVPSETAIKEPTAAIPQSAVPAIAAPTEATAALASHSDVESRPGMPAATELPAAAAGSQNSTDAVNHIAAPPAETKIAGTQTDLQAQRSPSAVAAGQPTSSSAKPLDGSTLRDLLNFGTSVTQVPNNTSSAPNLNGIDGAANRPIAKDSAANSPPSDTTPTAALLGSSLPQIGVSPALLPAHPAGASPLASSHEKPNLVEQLQPVLHQAMSQDRALTMTLRPPELGAVRIDVQHRDGHLSARLQTETAAAHQLLTEQLPQLRDVLTQMGVASDQVQVIRAEAPSSSAQSSFLADRQADAQQSGGRQESQQQHSPEPQRIDEPEHDDSQRPAILTRTALNLRI